MSDTPTPRTDALMEQWDYSPVVSVLIKHASQLERELAEAKSDDALNARILAQHAEQIAELQEERRDLEVQLTDHKSALEKCEKALSATWADLDHLNHWMPTPCRELYMEAKLELAKLKGQP